MDFQYSIRMFYITTTLSLWLRAKAEYFTAIAHIEPLLNTQKKVIDNLEEYVAYEEKRLVVLKKHLNRYKQEHILAAEDITEYLENPINAFTLIKRLTIDLEFLQNSILVSSDYVKNIITNIPDVVYPALEDLTGAIQGLNRLQKTYRLDIGELAEGRLIDSNSRGSKDSATSSTPMTANDCYELGETLYAEEDYRNALLWMMESLRKLTSGDDLFNTTEADVLEYISHTHYQLGDMKTAIEWSKKLLILHPEHLGVSNNIKILQKMVDDRELEIQRRGETDKDQDHNDDKISEPLETPYSLEDDIIYTALCRGDIDIPREIQRRLKCSYLTKNHPFLKLAPIKMEQIYIGPDVFLFHEVMSDEEIEHIKNLAKPEITRAQVVNPDSETGITVPYRISKTTWLHEDESEVLERISRRTADFTGFNMDTAEKLQVANYGIGGYYAPHFDFDDEHLSYESEDGDRIATVLFYMSDVAQGGATVFTEIGLTVFPMKNSALFWINLLPSGEGDIATQHAACPVLRGSKWASNKWIYNIGQELINPCSREL